MSGEPGHPSSTQESAPVGDPINSGTASGSADLSTAIAPTFHALDKSPRKGFQALLPGQLLGDFELLRLLGEGAFSQVFLARQISLDRQVALKVTANRGNEARTLASLEHDCIVGVFGETVDVDRDLRLLCMQFVPGATLDRIIAALRKRPKAERHGRAMLETIDGAAASESPLHPAALRDRRMLEEADLVQAVCWLGARLAEALDYAHDRGVLHRDIKPANVLVSPYGRPLLADFNLAFRSDDAAEEATQTFGGTLAYMAPEHLDAFNHEPGASAAAVDQRSDLYALGMVLFEMLTGAPAFPYWLPETGRREAVRRMAAQRRAAAPLPTEKNPDVPPALEHIIRRCLDPQPDRRYQSGRRLARALDGCRELRRIHRELPTAGPLTRVAERRPFRALVVLMLAPQLVAGLVNSAYNALLIAPGLTAPQQTIFPYVELGYGVVVIALCLMVLKQLIFVSRRTWVELDHSEAVASEKVNAVRRDMLAWPRTVVVVACAGWLPGCLLFPLALYLASPTLSAATIGHSLISFALSGLIAVTSSFFGMQYLVLRVLYPRLWVETQDVQEALRSELRLVTRRLRFFQHLAGAIPLAAAVVMLTVGQETSGTWTFRLLVTALIIMGMTGFGVAVMVNNYLLETLATLTRTRGRPANWTVYLNDPVSRTRILPPRDEI